MGTALAGFRTRGGRIRKAKLRSENMLFALEPLPAGVIGFSKKIVDLTKGILSRIHEFRCEGLFSSLPRISLIFTPPRERDPQSTWTHPPAIV